ncbi:hypothetical protein vseg_011366 [Gypsophila vaccaria]
MSSGGNADDLVMLEEPTKLRKLANIILRQEEALMDRMESEAERVKYLENCNGSYDGVIKLLEDIEALVQKYKESNKDIVEIVENIQHYVNYCMNMGMQCIRNCSLRVTCINKIQAHFEDLSRVLGELPSDDVAAVRKFAEEVTAYKEYMWKYANSCRSASARATSEAFSKLIKQEGLTFDELVAKSKSEIGLVGEFEELEEADQLKVYQSIIEKSGRASMPTLEAVFTAGGTAVLIAAAGLIAFDIFESDYKLEAVVRNSFNVAGEVGLFAIQLAAEEAIVAEAEFETTGLLIVASGSFISGALIGLLFTAVSGALLDAIFGSGGKVEPLQIGMQFRKLDFPDGMTVACEISHDDD